MISYSRDSKEAIPSSAVKIIGLGGAGANMLERIALDSIEGAELLALNTDIRTLGASLAKEKIQLGVNLTKGLGTGGDPELGQQAMLEAESRVREALHGQKIVFLCTGLGGGTGSGAAPIVARIAREEGAFVVVFATMPFFFEGRRRREQAETSLNQLAVLSNALVTFDNNRMGELVLAKQGIHEAFAAADKMISESIKAVIRLVIRPGLINVGLDDLMSALRTNRSRCLFGSGVADGKDRASKALRNALSSPLLDQGSLLKDAETVLVHLSGGESLTLFEIELLMQNLQKHVPDRAHVLFGAAIDPAMGDSLSITLISALPEDALTGGNRQDPSESTKSSAVLDAQNSSTPEAQNPFTRVEIKQATPKDLPEPEQTSSNKPDAPFSASEISSENIVEIVERAADQTSVHPAASRNPLGRLIGDAFGGMPPEQSEASEFPPTDEKPTPANPFTIHASAKEERPFAERELIRPEDPQLAPAAEPETLPDEGTYESAITLRNENPDPAQTATETTQPSTNKEHGSESSPASPESLLPQEPNSSEATGSKTSEKRDPAAPAPAALPPQTKLKLDSVAPGSQSELSFDNAPRGRFEGENPNVFEGEDLDLPPFLRKKKS